MRRLRPKWCWAAEIKIQIFSYRFGSVQASLIRQPLPVERDKVGLLQQFGTNSQGRANWNGLSSISLVSLAAPLGLPLSPPLSLSFFGLILWRRVALLPLVKTDFATVTSWAWYWLSWAPCLTYLYDGHPHIRRWQTGRFEFDTWKEPLLFPRGGKTRALPAPTGLESLPELTSVLCA